MHGFFVLCLRFYFLHKTRTFKAHSSKVYYLEEVVEGDVLGFRSVHLLTVLLVEEEPVSEGHVKQVCLVPV